MKTPLLAIVAAGMCMNGLAESIKLPVPDMNGGLRGEQYRWIRRIDGQSP